MERRIFEADCESCSINCVCLLVGGFFFFFFIDLAQGFQKNDTANLLGSLGLANSSGFLAGIKGCLLLLKALGLERRQGLLLSLLGGNTTAESVLGNACDGLRVPHTASSGGRATLGLDAPVEGAKPGRGISAGSTAALLNVIRAEAASHTQGVRLVVAATE